MPKKFIQTVLLTLLCSWIVRTYLFSEHGWKPVFATIALAIVMQWIQVALYSAYRRRYPL